MAIHPENPLLLLVQGGKTSGKDDRTQGLKPPSNGQPNTPNHQISSGMMPNTKMEWVDKSEGSSTQGSMNSNSIFIPEMYERMNQDTNTGKANSTGNAPHRLSDSSINTQTFTQSSLQTQDDTASALLNGVIGSQIFQVNAHGLFSPGGQPATISNDDPNSQDAGIPKKVFDLKVYEQKYRRFLFNEGMCHSSQAIEEFVMRCFAPPTLQVRLPAEKSREAIGSERERRLCRLPEEEQEEERKKMERYVRFAIAKNAAQSRHGTKVEEQAAEDATAKKPRTTSDEFARIAAESHETTEVAEEEVGGPGVKKPWRPSEEPIEEEVDVVPEPVLEDPKNTMAWPALSDATVSRSTSPKPSPEAEKLSPVKLVKKEDIGSTGNEDKVKEPASETGTDIGVKVSYRTKSSPSPSPSKSDQKKKNVQKPAVEDDDEFRVPRSKKSILAQKKREENMRIKAMKAAAQKGETSMSKQSSASQSTATSPSSAKSNPFETGLDTRKDGKGSGRSR